MPSGEQLESISERVVTVDHKECRPLDRGGAEGAHEIGAPPDAVLRSDPKAARLRVIMTSAKPYNPIASPIARCIVMIAASQNARVFRSQMNNGYPVSRRHTEMARKGSRFFAAISVSGGSKLNGGRISARQMLTPFHQPGPAHLAIPPKK